MRNKTVFLFLFFCVVISTHAFINSYCLEAPKNLWKAVLLESAGESGEGRYAVVCVFHNRLKKGMSLGSSGLKRKNIDTWILKNTTQALRDETMEIIYRVFSGKYKDITNGATHFESTDFGTPWWAKKIKVTTKIGKHIFYK